MGHDKFHWLLVTEESLSILNEGISVIFFSVLGPLLSPVVQLSRL